MKLPGAQRNGIHKMKKHPNDPTVTEKIPQKFEGMRLPLGCRCRPGDVWSNVVHVSQNLVQEDPHPMASKGLVSQAQDLAIGWCWHWWDLTI